MLYCGWDGGGTKTEVVLRDETGQQHFSAVFGPLNPNGASRDRVPETVRSCVHYMKEAAGDLSAVGGLVVGMAGISSHSARDLVEKALSEAGWQGPLRLAGDQEIALSGAVEGPGLLLIAGTGSVCCGRDREGRSFRVGGYGYLIDDGGSGWAIGRDMLSALARSADGRESSTVLTDLIFERLGLHSLSEVITWLYDPAHGKGDVAALAALLPEALTKGDGAADRIARQAAEELSLLAETAWRKSGLEEAEIAFTGSILTRMPEIRQRVEARLAQTCPRLRPISPRCSPGEGAAKMALELFGQAV